MIQPRRSYYKTFGVDYYGYDIIQYVGEFISCETACDALPGCVGYVESWDSYNRCYMKNGFDLSNSHQTSARNTVILSSLVIGIAPYRQILDQSPTMLTLKVLDLSHDSTNMYYFETYQDSDVNLFTWTSFENIKTHPMTNLGLVVHGGAVYNLKGQFLDCSNRFCNFTAQQAKYHYYSDGNGGFYIKGLQYESWGASYLVCFQDGNAFNEHYFIPVGINPGCSVFYPRQYDRLIKQ